MKWHDCDDIIIKTLASSPNGCVYDEPIWLICGTFGTSTMLFERIKKTYPTISKATFQRHLDKMVEHGMLRKLIGRLLRSPGAGTTKRTFYLLTRDIYVDITDRQRYPKIRSNREPRIFTVWEK